MANINMSTQSSSQQNRDIHDGSVAIFWDLKTCPVPSNMHFKEAASNIKTALRAHKINGPITIFSAYKEVTRPPRPIIGGCTMVGVAKGRSVFGDILVDMFLSALDRRPPAYIMLISGDRNFSRALHLLRDYQYTTILVIPSRVSVLKPFRYAGNFVWDWSNLAKTSRCVQPREKVIKAVRIYNSFKTRIMNMFSRNI